MDPELRKTTPTADIPALVLKIVGEMSGAVDVAPDSDLVAELGFDSLGLLELLAVLEDALDLPSIDTETVDKMEKVADILRVVQEARAQKLPAGLSK